jgi:carbamate kinase
LTGSGRRIALIAIGGNALVRAGDASVDAQRASAAEVAKHVAGFAAEGWRVVVTHGNGPQVGAALLRSERAGSETYPMPLDVCVASTQGEMGYLLGGALEDELRARGRSSPVATVVTRVLVSPDDPAFRDPTKPVGPFYGAAEAEARRQAGWTLVEQPPRGFRRLVPSPEPLEILEERVIRMLLGNRAVVITLGGGGIPVARAGDGVVGVEAVVDKDLSSALLAVLLKVDLFLILTDVDSVYLDFGTSRAAALRTVSATELRAHSEAGHFAPGSMGPKVDAVLRYLERGGRRAIVTLPEHVAEALAGEAGTNVWRGSR